MRIGFRWIIVLLLPMLLMLTLILLRQPLLEYALKVAGNKLNQRYGLDLQVADAGFSGFRDIYLEDLSLSSSYPDTLLQARRIEVRIRLSSLLGLKLRFRELVADSMRIHLAKYENGSNYSSLFAKADTASQPSRQSDYRARVRTLVRLANELFDERVSVRSFELQYTEPGQSDFLRIPELYLEKDRFRASLITSSSEGVNLWLAQGSTQTEESTYSFRIKKVRGGNFPLPFINRFDGLKVSFDSAEVYLSFEPKEDPLPADAQFSIHNLSLDHWRISPEPVVLPLAEMKAKAFFYSDSVVIGDSSTCTINRLPVSWSAAWMGGDSSRLRMTANFSQVPADDFFGALPRGMFQTLSGIRTSGTLSWNFSLDLPLRSPEQLMLSAAMTKNNFRILSYGRENFARINSPFIFLAYNDDQPVRSFLVGNDNPSFSSLQSVSPYLINAVLTSEDPSFFRHNGFVMESISESIAKNVRERRFARGGSTISMQLAKNVFLNRNKTIARKLEEVIIVWLMESMQLVPKERMMEVYLNIIEWGPGIYGISEASGFYFDKTPDKLNLSESIFLASLIPSPRYYRSRLDSSGHIRSSLDSYYKLIASRVLSRALISPADTDSLSTRLRISEKVWRRQAEDSLGLDTLLLPLGDDKTPELIQP